MGRRRRLSQFRDYLERRVAPAPPSRGTWAMPIALLLSGGAWYLLFQRTPLWMSIVLTLCIVLPILTGIAASIQEKASRPRTVEEEVLTAAVGAHSQFKSLAEGNRLHRQLDPACAALLEECARQWCRIHDQLQQPVWRQSDLPAHWRTVRDQSMKAADQAMDEILIRLQPTLKKQAARDEWESAFKEFVEDVIGLPLMANEMLPAEFESARVVGERLMQLAEQVEKATESLRTETRQEGLPSAIHSIDLALSELRSIQQAESELKDVQQRH